MIKPDNFEKDPYGYATNQISHALWVGKLLLLWLPCFVFYKVFGEYPHKEHIFIFAACVYSAIEYAQGWNGFDTIEDFVFSVVFGVGGPLYVYSEVEPGSPLFSGDINKVVPVVGAFCIWLALGAAWRWYNEKLG